MAPDLVVCHGVGYRVTTPTPLADGEPVSLHVVTIVREDALDLYGFTSPVEATLFRMLLRVSQVGPKLAIAMLGDLGAARTAHAISAKDHKTLSTCRGVGPKLAQKMCVDLTIPEELLLLLGGAPDDATADATADPSGDVDEIFEALVSLGFGPDSARDAVAAARLQNPGCQDESTLVSAALRAVR